MSAATPYLDRILDPVTDCFTPQLARRIAELRADPQTASYLDLLAAKANEGQLTAEEDSAYKQLVDAIDLVSILQAKARAYLRQQSVS